MMAGSEPWITLGRSYDQCLRLVADPNREVYVAQGEDAVLGFVVLLMTGAFTGYVQTLCAAPEARGRGIGTALLRFAEERILRDTPNVFMSVSSFNEGALRLYLRLGYARIGEVHDYIVRGHSEILLRKTRGPLMEFRKA
jgi:[ribosomal protein S18]-alanine N-acetyltransferase